MTHRTVLPLLIAVATVLAGCESVSYRKIEIAHEGFSVAEVSGVVSDFAAKHGFTCGTRTEGQLQECRALGPRFLSVQSTAQSSVVELAQPYPWSPGGAPSSYAAAVQELTDRIAKQFGKAARVVR